MVNKHRARFSGQSHEFASAAERLTRLFNLAVTQDRASALGLEVVLQNKVAGAKFQFIPQDGSGWRACIGQLIDDQFPEQPIFVTKDTILHSFDIIDVADVRIDRIPELVEQLAGNTPLSAKDVCLIVERCCDDIFRGDFSLFTELRERVMQRPESAVNIPPAYRDLLGLK